MDGAEPGAPDLEYPAGARDWVEQLWFTDGGITSNFERTEALLLKIFPSDQVSAIMAEISCASAALRAASTARLRRRVTTRAQPASAART